MVCAGLQARLWLRRKECLAGVPCYRNPPLNETRKLHILYSDLVEKLHNLPFLLTIDYMSRQGYKVSLVMAPCEE